MMVDMVCLGGTWMRVRDGNGTRPRGEIVWVSDVEPVGKRLGMGGIIEPGEPISFQGYMIGKLIDGGQIEYEWLGVVPSTVWDTVERGLKFGCRLHDGIVEQHVA